MIIRPEPLTREAFVPFGDVIELNSKHATLINRGQTEKFAELARLVTTDGADMSIAIYRSQPAKLPFTLDTLECHPVGSQAFFPLHNRPFPIVVALAGSQPGVADVRAFLSNGLQGVNLHPGTWHHYQISLEEVSDYLVIERNGEGNLEEVELDPVAVLHL